MKTDQKLIEKINSNKELLKNINKVSYYGTEGLIRDAIRYIKAIKSGRAICSINKVSASGMSRQMAFYEIAQRKDKRYQLMNFYAFFKAMGHTAINNSDYFRINGCGMDMVFHTNYSNIHTLARLGFITKKECDSLAQMTPPVL